jgi:hypothetical protein
MPRIFKAHIAMAFMLPVLLAGSRSDAGLLEACRPAYRKLASLFTRPSASSLQDDVRITGQFELQKVGWHHDIFRAKLPDETPFIFRTGAERAKKEVSAYRFAKAAGFDVPQTVYADINGRSGSVQRMVDGLPLASELDGPFNSKAPKITRADPATRIFDSLLGLNDRNSTNFFVRPDGSQVLIDNEGLFHPDRSAMTLRDGLGEYLDIKVIRRFIQLDPERARQLANPINESNYLWALRDVSDSNRSDFSQRLKIYREYYRKIQSELRSH